MNKRGDLLLGSLSGMPRITKEQLASNDKNIESTIYHFLKRKKHNILIANKQNPKANFNNPIYLKYVLDNGILSTNAVVNEPTFQGYSNIYIDRNVQSIAIQSTKDKKEFSLQKNEILINTTIDKKGQTHNTVAITTQKGDLKTTKFLFNRSDKDSSQRNSTSISTEELSKNYGFEVPKDNIPKGTEVARIREIRESEKGSAATVVLKNIETGESWDAEVVIEKRAKIQETKLKKAVIIKEQTITEENIIKMFDSTDFQDMNIDLTGMPDGLNYQQIFDYIQDKIKDNKTQVEKFKKICGI